MLGRFKIGTNMVADLSGGQLAGDVEHDAGMSHGDVSSPCDLVAFGIVGWWAIEALLDPDACLGAPGSLLWHVGGSGGWYRGARDSNCMDLGELSRSAC